MKFLVVAAWEPELAAFRTRAGTMAAGDVVMETMGVGLVEAAIAMTRCVERHRPSAALLLGTCGAFALPIGTVVTASKVHLACGGITDGAAALPAPMPATASFDEELHAALVAAGAKSVQIANTLGITIDDALASRLAASGGVEHLEAFAFARACAAAGGTAIPCAVVLGVANVVGARGRAEWLANQDSASAKAADVAYKAMAAMTKIAMVKRPTKAP